MTTAQAQQFEAGLQRATRDGCYIVGRGIVKASGLEYFGVQSRMRTYFVAIHRDTLICTCKAGQSGCYCKHRALVRQWMEECSVRSLGYLPDISEPVELAEYCGDLHSDEANDSRDSAILMHAPQSRSLYRSTRH